MARPYSTSGSAHPTESVSVSTACAYISDQKPWAVTNPPQKSPGKTAGHAATLLVWSAGLTTASLQVPCHLKTLALAPAAAAVAYNAGTNASMTAMLTPATPTVLVSAGVSAGMSAVLAIPTCTRSVLLLTINLRTPAARAVRVIRAALGASRVIVGLGTAVVTIVRAGVVRIAGMSVAPAMRSNWFWMPEYLSSYHGSVIDSQVASRIQYRYTLF